MLRTGRQRAIEGRLLLSTPREFPRPAAADFAPIVALLGASGLPTADLALPALAHFRVSRDGERIVAVAGLQPLGSAGLLRSVAVTPELRGTGLATRLVAALEGEAARMGITTLWLLTNTAEAFFATRGYTVLPRDAAPAALQDTAEFRQLCPDSAVCMQKSLR